jgi:hypothetical protein
LRTHDAIHNADSKAAAFVAGAHDAFSASLPSAERGMWEILKEIGGRAMRESWRNFARPVTSFELALKMELGQFAAGKSAKPRRISPVAR